MQQLSIRRSFQSSEAEAAFVEDDLAAFLAETPSGTEQPSGTTKPSGTMGPVYRLVCWLFVMPLSILPLIIPKGVNNNDA